MTTEREFAFVCTASDPWAPGKPTPVLHPEARQVGDQENGWPGGDYVRYHCPTCGREWRRELPQ